MIYHWLARSRPQEECELRDMGTGIPGGCASVFGTENTFLHLRECEPTRAQSYLKGYLTSYQETVCDVYMSACDSSSHKSKRIVSRKDARKQARQDKKTRTIQHHEAKRKPVKGDPAPLPKSSVSTTTKKRPAPPAESSGSATKKRRISTSRAEGDVVAAQVDPPPKFKKSLKSTAASASQQKTGKPKARPELTIDDLLPSRSRGGPDSEAREIERLEGLLGLSKKSSKSKSRYGDEFAEDGLDVIRIHLSEDDDDGDGGSDEGDEESSVALDESEDESEGSPDDGLDAEEWNGIQSEPDGDEASDGEDEKPNQASPTSPSSQEPNPEPSALVRLITGSPIVTRYIPPHLRQPKKDEGTIEDIKLRRQIKGLLNRMSEQNIENILGEFLALYRANPRNMVTTTITTQILDGITSHSSLLDSFVILHATLVASLHKLVGIDFAAHFVETCISSYENHLSSAMTSLTAPAPSTEEAEDQDISVGKECMNLMVLISELYNFQVISCLLVYDLIRNLLVGEISELRVELLLKVTRNSGSQMRQDDPLALRDIVQLVQSKTADKNPRDLSSRVRFMLETLGNLKNNSSKVKQSAAQAQGQDTVGRLRKFLSGLSKKHHILAHEPLNVSLNDLHSADKKGKWWLVGSAWAGNPLVDAKDSSKSSKAQGKPSAPSTTTNVEEALMKLARKQGMNTEVRRSIFVVMMSSDDYVDACERLGHLSLSEIQRREIGRVLIHCCGNEKVYNPYYTMIGQQLCRTSHAFQITLQYCLWDFLREIGEKEVGGTQMIANLDPGTTAQEEGGDAGVTLTKLRNVASAYAWWMAKGSVSLSTLKAVPLESLKAQGVRFFETFFAQFLIGTQSSSPLHSITTLASKGKLPFGKDIKVLDELVLKVVAQHTNLAAGMYKFLSRVHWEKIPDVSIEMMDFLVWGTAAMMAIVKEGLDV
ncbi:hypothetical protein DL93DRAFT_2124903 [Clavulina sp. PMI_390]|nr:hypothetical protein DL93DRAFT_2124903 [Clavulina sp. PMI_390]